MEVIATLIPLIVAGFLGSAEEARFLFALREQADCWVAEFVRDGVLQADEKTRFFAYLNYAGREAAAPYFADELDRLYRRRAEQIDRAAPPLEDLHRLPPQSVCVDNYQLGRKYLRYLHWELDGAVTTSQQQLLGDAIANTEWRVRFWGSCWDCLGNYGGNDRGRRLWLAEIRDQIGLADYLDSKWPDPLPVTAYLEDWFSPPDWYEK